MRPLLLLDVDGVLMPLGQSVPPGFERRETATYAITVSPSHAPWLRSLATDFDLVWATTWGEAANEILGPYFGLARLEVLALPDLPREGTRKLAAVAQFAGDRPLAWVDDELYDDAEQWARDRDAATLLVRTAPYVGLQESHVASLLAFAGSLR